MGNKACCADIRTQAQTPAPRQSAGCGHGESIKQHWKMRIDNKTDLWPQISPKCCQDS